VDQLIHVDAGLKDNEKSFNYPEVVAEIKVIL
jgi:hypothetical protein